MNRCALILADGREEKTLPSRFEAGRSTVLEYILDSVWTVADEIFVVFGGEPSIPTVERIAPFGVKAVIDRDGKTTFSKVMAGLRASSSEDCLVTTSSSPFVKPSVLFHLFEGTRGFDAAIPRWASGKTEPLLSVYSRRAFLKASSGLKKRTMAGLVDRLYDVCYVSVEGLLAQVDPELDSFFRIEGESDLRKARQMAASRVRD